MMADWLMLLDISFLDGDMFKQVIMPFTRYIVIRFVNFV